MITLLYHICINIYYHNCKDVICSKSLRFSEDITLEDGIYRKYSSEAAIEKQNCKQTLSREALFRQKILSPVNFRAALVT